MNAPRYVDTPAHTCSSPDRVCRVAPFFSIMEMESVGVMVTPQWPREFRTLVCRRHDPYTCSHTTRCLIAIRPGGPSPDRDQPPSSGTSQDPEGRCRA